ncbi:MAG: RNA polymerase subunit sigma-24 [Acidobacteriia bacterium 12-62-4]|nr:MAG: RNA polymerase subunit sigma-24 [Acidobacteriia bacterium 12-62-4]
MDEASLIRAAQRGDEDAFALLVRAHDQSVLRIALNLLRSPEDARDVYQETFLRVHRSLQQFRFDCNFSTWLHRIATNICLDHLRRRKVRREAPRVALAPSGQELDPLDSVAEPRADSDPQRRVLSEELRGRIQAVLAELSPRERVVFEMRHFEGMRLRAIGEALGTSEEAAKNCLFRATQKMRVALGEFV